MAHNVIQLQPKPPAAKIQYTELFYSLEGEGPLVGMPTVFLRFFGCNLTCAGFGMNGGKKEHTVGANTLEEVDALGITSTGGCDSAYSWHPLFKNLRKTDTIESIIEKIYELLPANLRNPQTTMPDPTWVLSLTGGEPLLHQKAIAAMLHKLVDLGNASTDWLRMRDLPRILIETNGTQVLQIELVEAITRYQGRSTQVEPVVFSVSPKLSNSGEDPSVALNPRAFRSLFATEQESIYLKYVSDGSIESFEEIQRATEILFGSNEEPTSETGAEIIASMLGWVPIYVMPEGSTVEQLRVTAPKVAKMCMQRGFNYSPRLHVDLFGNAVGT